MKHWVFIVLIVILQCIFYFGYVGNYLNYQHLNQLPSFYSEDIYQYRILSVKSFEIFQEYFTQFMNYLNQWPYFTKSLQNLGTPFYLSLMVFNTIFYVLAYLVLDRILSLQHYFKIKEKEKILTIVFSILVIGISQYVLTPYDLSSYFLLFVGIWLSLKYFEKSEFNYLFFLCLIIIFSTLNRETSALNISFFALLWFHKNNNSLFKKTKIWPLALVILVFILTYIGIRLYIGKTQVVQNIYLVQNLTEIKNLLGIAFFGIVLYFTKLFSNSTSWQSIKQFLFLASPYILVIFLSGILWEIRLFVPLILPIFILLYLRWN